MKNNVFAYILIFAICSCAPITQQQKDRWGETMPACFNKVGCSAKWAAARNWVQDNAGYKIQIYSDDLIETYNPSQNSPNIAVSVRKNPLMTTDEGEQVYVFQIKVWCNNIFGCIPSADESILKFNNYVSSIQANDVNCYKSIVDNKNPKLGIFFLESKTKKFIIKDICFNSPAQKAGLQPNDILYKIDDKVINSAVDFKASIQNIKFGSVVKIEVIRNDINLSYQVKFPLEEEIVSLTTNSDKKDKNQTSQNIDEKLESLRRLLNKGLIDKDEYEIKKKQLLKEL